jgi:hypothetical protein
VKIKECDDAWSNDDESQSFDELVGSTHMDSDFKLSPTSIDLGFGDDTLHHYNLRSKNN